MQRTSTSLGATKQSPSQLRWQGLLSNTTARNSQGVYLRNARPKKVLVEPMMRNLGIDWDHGDKSPMAGLMTFQGMIDGTNYSLPAGIVGNPQYAVGCVPTAMGQTMYYLIKYRYGLTDNEISSINVDDEYTVGLEYERNDPQTGVRGYDTIRYRMKRLNRNYAWSDMPDDTYNPGNSAKALRSASPLLKDLGIAIGANYKLFLPLRPSDSPVTYVGEYPGAETYKNFGMAHAVHSGGLSTILTLDYQELRQIVETNLDYGHPVHLDYRGHAVVVDGYARDLVRYNELSNSYFQKGARDAPTYFHVRQGYGIGNEYYWSIVKGTSFTDFGTGLITTRLNYNIFPKIPNYLNGSEPEIVSGRVVLPSGAPGTDLAGLKVKAAWEGQNVDAEYNPDTGVYAVAVPPNTQITLSVLDSTTGEIPIKFPFFKPREAKSGRSNFFTGNRWGLDFLPPATVMTTSVTDNNEEFFDKTDKTYQVVADADITAVSGDELLSDKALLYVASNTAFDIAASANIGEALANTSSFVNSGGTLISTGKSTIFPGSLGGAGSPRFYSFSGVPRPYGTSQIVNTTIAVGQKEIIDRLGGVRNFQMTSALPVNSHSLIDTVGNATIMSIGQYVFEDLVWWGGYPALDYYLMVIPNAVEYNVGTNGGKVVYMNGEFASNYNTGGLSRAFVEAVVDPLIFKVDDEIAIARAVGRDYYDDPAATPNAINQANLNMVVYNNGIKVPNSLIGEDVSFVFTITERRVTSTAPQIDADGDPNFVLSLVTPSGDIYATRQAVPGDYKISMGVPAADNTQAGDWKYVVETVSGFDGNRVVLTASVDGLYDHNLEYLTEYYESISDDLISGATRNIANSVKSYPRGLLNGTFHHQLGDNRSVLNDGTVKTVAFGPLVRAEDIRVWRIDDDLVLGIAGAVDQVTIQNWFNASRGNVSNVSEVTFYDGTVLSATDLNLMAEEREPDITYEVISIDNYIAGTDENDRLEGNPDTNEIFFAGKGSDTVVGNGGSNVYYYYKGDDNLTIINSKGDGDVNALRFHLDITSSDVTISRSGDDIKFEVAGSGNIIVKKWYGDPTAKLDRIEFSGGDVWDVRDIEKLAQGKQLQARQLFIVAPDTAHEDGEDEDTTVRSENDSTGGSSGCNTGSIAFAMVCLLGVFMAKRQRRN